MHRALKSAQAVLVLFTVSFMTACGAANSSQQKSNADTALLNASGKHSMERPVSNVCEDSPELTCYPVAMPLDHDDGASSRMTVNFGVKPAADKSREALLVLFGGPGDPAVYSLGRWLQRISPEMRQRFEIVTMDLRGVRASEAMDCAQASVDFSFVPPWTYEEAERLTLAEGAKTAAAACVQELNRAPEVLQHYNTMQAAADLETFRILMGYSSWSIYSLSYGTQLAQTYVTQYPGRTKALVLDGAVDLTVDLLGYGRDLALAQNSIVQQLDSSCASLPECKTAFSDSRGKVATFTAPTEVYDLLFKQLLEAAAPVQLKNADGTVQESSLGAYDLEYALAGSVGSPGGRARFLWALAQAYQSEDFAPLYRIADGQPEAFSNIPASEKKPDIAGKSAPGMSSGVFWTFVCNDYGSPAGATYEDRFAQFVANAQPYVDEGLRLHAPFFSEAVCADWPLVSQDVVRPAPFMGKDVPTLVIGAEADANVPYSHAVQIAQHLHMGQLVTVSGSQHVSYSYHISCVNQAVEALLLEGALPAEDLRCTDDFVGVWPFKGAATQ
jgi:pimeloyl-ACP methyl ester carboxylesterase